MPAVSGVAIAALGLLARWGFAFDIGAFFGAASRTALRLALYGVAGAVGLLLAAVVVDVGIVVTAGHENSCDAALLLTSEAAREFRY
jgi:hypothetical protein